MLAFTPAVEHALGWFEATHEIDFSQGIARWRRIGLPGPGPVGEQDAVLMETLDFLQAVHNDMVRPRTTPRHG